MKKSIKSLLTVLIVAMMVLGLSITSFAGTTHSVTVHIIRRDATTNPATVTYFTELPSPGTITLQSVDSDTTVKDIVTAAMAQQSTPSAPFSASFTYVPVSTYNPTAYYYLGGMTLGGTPYNGSYNITDYGDDGWKQYTGTSWVWNYDGGNTYPNDYMDQTTIGSNTAIWLIYETSSFIYDPDA